MARISLITIDLDDTVWPCRPAIMSAEQALHDWLSETAGRLAAQHDIWSLREHRRRVMRERPDIAHDLTAVRMASLRMLLAEFGYSPDLAGPACQLFLHHRNQVTPYVDVAPVLAALRARFCLVAMTNGNADVERTPLTGCFDSTLSAAEVGHAKPHPAMFRWALERYGLSPDKALHVGDDPLLDVQAAAAVGMATLWVNRLERVWPADVPPADASASDFYGLLSWLDGNADEV